MYILYSNSSRLCFILFFISLHVSLQQTAISRCIIAFLCMQPVPFCSTCLFLFLFTLHVLFLPKVRNYLPQHVHLIRVHTLCMNYGHSIMFVYMRTISKLLEHYTIVRLLFTYLGLLRYIHGRRILPLWSDRVCQPVQRLLYLYTYLFYSNCNMLLNVTTYLIRLLAHAIYPTYLINLHVLSNVCILDFTPLSYCASVDRAVA